MRVLFYGTPEFAVPSLMALVGEGFDVVGVVTRPDAPTGRHRSAATPSPVKLAALDEEIPVFEPVKPSAPEFIAQMQSLAPDVAVVAAYGHILKPDLLAIPVRGSWNVHASLLPKLRGAAPIERAILEGHEQTGISIMRMEAGLDTGPVLHAVSTPIEGDETGGELRARLAELGALALIEALTLMDEESGAQAKPQDNTAATYAAKLTREEERIDWAESCTAIARKIRAFDPKPGAWTEVNGRPVKLFGAREVSGGRRSSDEAGGRREAGEDGESGRRAEDALADTPVVIPGTVLLAGDKLVISCGRGAVAVTDVQPAGKAKMTAAAFVNGRGASAGDVVK
jgi:methionyl-tRNA formyltransferase